METNNNELFQQNGLSKISQFSYAENLNAFVGEGYRSQAGNTYFNSVRFVEGIFIKEEVGEGYIHTFLNGLKIIDIQKRTLISERSYHCRIYSKSFIIDEVVEMLVNVLTTKSNGVNSELKKENVIGQVNAIVMNAFETDQRVTFQNQMGRLLTA
jgi:hypothetical protein